MLNKLERFIREKALLTAGDTVTCAVSGGADSMALLWGLYLLKDKLSLDVRAAHFNHRLRGEESDADAAFVREFCGRFEIPLSVGSGEVKPGSKGLEAAARDARYAFLETLPGKIATAHTADDNAETLLMHLVRGTGLKGLGGIAEARGRIIRPMLTVTRQEVLAFLEEYHIPHREDSSNETDDFLRNRLRHHVMPLLKAENPRLSQNLSAMAQRLRQDEAALQTISAPETPLKVEWLRSLMPAVRSRVLETFLKESGVLEPEAEHIALAEALVFSPKPSAHARFPGGITVRRCYDILQAEPTQTLPRAVTLECPGEAVFGDYRIVCTVASEIINTADTFTLMPQGKLTVRSRQSGDTIRTSGGTKSLKKLFIDRKIPAHLRPGIPVLADDTGVLAAEQIGADREKQAKILPAWQIKVIKT